MSTTGLPFDDFRALVEAMPGPDMEAVAAVKKREAELTKPQGSLGRLEEIVEWLAAWQGNPKPRVTRPLVAVFAGNHGVAKRGVSAFPIEVTEQMVSNFAAGGAAINQLCIANDLGLKVFELALEVPTGDICVEDAFEEADCAATMAFGMEALSGGSDLVCLGEMGIGNTTVAAAIFYALFGGTAEQWVGPGTGVKGEALALKVKAVEDAVARCGGPQSMEPFEVLRRLGGREIAAMTGLILAARMQHVPVLIDGFVTTSAAAVLYQMDKTALDHCMFAHASAEPSHRKAIEAMNGNPLLDLGMRLGEGTGAAVAAGIVKAAAQTHSGMATFEMAGVKNAAGD
ncbi:nicotinate-nucleotide--dimethylbenzimidazole phosphoribosyltransferase [Pseudovibrio exalbescens]|uniref:nicotinate-nucleotide--dimethylbenzimidazole phosphoribosyltransferase n=1 Tax=Pseudovibrio exalbescens TaxID=197461 RepID=UPI0023652B8C|nr:nicotinate-nucleotide--dimethylbenzimidazole phosphoribosyltransferase [Pseudovibrio exalbescens]MDD7909064.1 nicotinate-nucleotide--dimethylbenzimidazole phosphoribosyltransferase [Pseudovibrio exalbescens]